MGDVAISGGTEEMEMEEGAGMKDWEDQGGRALTWQRFLPRMSLRVLLVEADDSTRQIISALLRKCNYRVAAAADGLKAWEMLKEKSQSIDLVLTEVELPSLSGYSLLNLIMEHDPCRRIPVIMMSSNDSINMVFKCMLKGASDFLVKPIRKNELRNLWQHVWRRHSFNGGPYGTCEHQVENCAQPKSGAHPENNAASSHSSDSIDSLQKKRNCSKKESDTQSSCTRPDMEAESAYMQNAEDQRQSSCINSSVTTYMGHKDDIGSKLDEEHSDKSTLILHVENNNQVVNSSDCTSEKEDPSARVTSQKIMISRGCMDYSKILSENNQTKLGLNKHSIEVDLIGTMDHQMQGEQQPRGCSVVQTDVSREKGSNDSKDQKVNSPLELSLQRYHHVSSEKQKKDELELNLLNHSHSSAFSRYNNRAVVSQLPMSNVLRDSEGQACTSSVIQPSNDPLRSSTYPCDGSSLNMHLEDSHSPGFHPSCQDGAAPCLNPGLLLYPYPVAGPSYDGHCSPHHSVMRPVFYTQQTPPAWSLSSAKQEVPHARLAPWTDQDTLNSGQKNCPGNQNSGKQNFEAEKKQMPNMESLDEKQVSSMTIQSSSVCHGSKNHPSSSGCGSVCNGSNGNLTTVNGSSMDVPGSSMESSNGHGHISYDGTKLVDIQRSIQREAALNKFRLKRKDRCYEKKVRYQSRKRLAEQRPRVKGQFVRQVKLDALASG